MLEIFNELIRDRIEADVMRRVELTKKWLSENISEEEKEEWFTNLKGSYNASDLNRVGNFINTVSAMLSSQGYGHKYDVKKDWKETDYINEKNTAYYLESLRAICESYFLLPESPNLPDKLSGLTWQKANAIEQIIYDMAVIFDLIKSNYIFSGEIFAGEF